MDKDPIRERLKNNRKGKVSLLTDQPTPKKKTNALRKTKETENSTNSWFKRRC